MAENSNSFVPPSNPLPSPTRPTTTNPSSSSPCRSSPSDRLVQALGHDYNGIQGTPVCQQQYPNNTTNIPPPHVSPRIASEMGQQRPTVTNTNGFPSLTNLPAGQLLQNVAGGRLGGYPNIPPGMMELRSPISHQQPYLPAHPYTVGFPTLSPTLAPLESPSPTPHSQLSPGFGYNSLPPFSQQFPQTPSPKETPSKLTEHKEKAGLSWLDAAYKVLEAAREPLHIEEIKKRILDQDLLKANARSSLESGLLRDVQRGSKRFRQVESKSGIFRLLTPEEVTEQIKKQAELNSRRVALMSQKSTETKEKMYERKYRALRKSIKHMVFENGALCDAVAQTQEKLSRARAERRFLLNRLLHYMAISGDMSLLQPNKPKVQTLEERRKERNGKRRRDKEKLKHRHKRAKKEVKETGKDLSQANVGDTEKKSAALTEKHYMLQIPLEPSGTPVFPIQLSDLKIHCLGYVIYDRPQYHTDLHIYTVGFCSSRLYASCKDPKKQCWYTCKIMDRGVNPLFEIQSEDDDDIRFSADSLNICHEKLLSALNDASGSQQVDNTTGYGAGFFGLSHPTVKNLIQSLPNARKCENYKWIKFETCPEKEKKKLEMWCSEDPKISFHALQKREEAKQFQAFASGKRREPFISLKRLDATHCQQSARGMTDSERLRSFLNRSNSKKSSFPVNYDKMPTVDVWNVEGETDYSEHIDVT